MEKVITVGIKLQGRKQKEVYNSLEELSQLVNTAGGEVIHTVIQSRKKYDPAYLIGKGKAMELAELCKKNNVKAVVFDENLTPTQQRNLEEITNAKIVDRTRLILDIFAARAKTKEAELQVELAQTKYFLPRLNQHGIWLDNQVGGIGTRGPGERKLEYDRRKLRDRISYLNSEIEKIKKHREIQRSRRQIASLPIIALVGYTNVGKSTLFNKIVNENVVYADNKLFATLDPTIRRIKLPSGRNALLTDTVGFIKKLPTELVASFRATLEVILETTCIVHVIDITSSDYKTQEKTVLDTLTQLGANKIPIIRAFNKIDLLPSYLTNQNKSTLSNNTIKISAKTGEGINELLNKIEEISTEGKLIKSLKIPYTRPELINFIYSSSKVLSQAYKNNTLKMKIETDLINWNKIQKQISKN